MKRLARSAGALVAGFLATSGAVLLSDRLAEPAVTRLGRLDIADYCRRQYGDAALAQAADRTAFAWRCLHIANGLVLTSEIDVDAACVLVFGGGARADLVRNDPYGWECIRKQ